MKIDCGLALGFDLMMIVGYSSDDDWGLALITNYDWGLALMTI